MAVMLVEQTLSCSSLIDFFTLFFSHYHLVGMIAMRGERKKRKIMTVECLSKRFVQFAAIDIHSLQRWSELRFTEREFAVWEIN